MLVTGSMIETHLLYSAHIWPDNIAKAKNKYYFL